MMKENEPQRHEDTKKNILLIKPSCLCVLVAKVLRKALNEDC